MAEPKNSTSWKVIILCFIGAATFWFFSALGKEYSYRIKYPIEFVFDRDSLVEVKPLPEFVDVDVSGGGWDLFKESFWFGSDPVRFELENPAAIRFLTRPTILPILTEELSQYRVNFLFTDTLFININNKSSRLVKLSIDSTQINLEQGFRLVSPIAIDPDTARIFGPTSFLDTLGDAFEIQLGRNELDNSFSSQVDISLPDGFDIYASPPSVIVGFDVELFSTLQIAATVEMMNFPEDSSVFITDPNVTIQFVVQESRKIDFAQTDFKVVVDYSMINEADSTAPAIVIVQPEQALELLVSPDTLSVSYANR